jgi:hypothetical protein
MEFVRDGIMEVMSEHEGCAVAGKLCRMITKMIFFFEVRKPERFRNRDQLANSSRERLTGLDPIAQVSIDRIWLCPVPLRCSTDC